MAGVLEGYALLKESLGDGAVENLASFWGTVSSGTDPAVRPELVCVRHGGGMVGFAVGAYLGELNMGFNLYSAVKREWRRRGIYTEMRNRLLGLFNREAEARGARPDRHRDEDRRVGYVIAELEKDSRLYRRYVTEWKAFVVPCDYEQPNAQGLEARDLKLVLQPIAKKTPPDKAEALAIVRAIYRRIYRIPNATDSPAFGRIAASLHETPGSPA